MQDGSQSLICGMNSEFATGGKMLSKLIYSAEYVSSTRGLYSKLVFDLISDF